MKMRSSLCVTAAFPARCSLVRQTIHIKHIAAPIRSCCGNQRISSVWQKFYGENVALMWCHYIGGAQRLVMERLPNDEAIVIGARCQQSSVRRPFQAIHTTNVSLQFRLHIQILYELWGRFQAIFHQRLNIVE